MPPRVRPDIAQMTGYAPGEWPALDAGVLKLNSNENPYPPSPQVLAALRSLGTPQAMEQLRRYPDPLGSAFRQVASKLFDLPPDWFVLGNGSDDLLTMIVRACAAGHERPLAYPMPTYILYRTLAAMQPAKAIEIPYAQTGSNWTIPIDALLEADAAVTFIATPNSPTGHQVSHSDLRRLAAGLSGILVVDEAYVDFVSDEADREAIALVKEFNNVILLRTFSKGYSLAGVRLGFGMAQPPLLTELLKVKDSYNVDAIALQLGTAALKDRDYKCAIARKVVKSRDQLSHALVQIGFTVWPSVTNFLLVQPPEGTQAAGICQELRASHKIMIRYFDQPGLDDKLRITVGTPEQNQQLVDAIQHCLSEATIGVQ